MEIKGNVNEQTSFWILSLSTASISFQLSSVSQIAFFKVKVSFSGRCAESKFRSQ